MAMSRSLGSTRFTRRPPILISPPLASSSPATRRSSVDFPQPDGPTTTISSRSAMVRSIPCMMTVVPKDLLTRERLTSAMSLLRLHEPAYEPALHYHDHQYRRQHRQQRRCHDQVPTRRHV